MDDFTIDGTTITISSFGRSTMITISGSDDGILEGSETIIISLANEADLQLLYPSVTLPDPVTITITDNDGMYYSLCTLSHDSYYKMVYLVGLARVVASDPAVTEFSDAVMVEAMFCVDLIVVAGTEVDIEVGIAVTSGNYRNLHTYNSTGSMHVPAYLVYT